MPCAPATEATAYTCSLWQSAPADVIDFWGKDIQLIPTWMEGCIPTSLFDTKPSTDEASAEYGSSSSFAANATSKDEGEARDMI